MSYDGYIVHDNSEDPEYPEGGGSVFEIGNSTTNHSPVWSRALEAAGFAPVAPAVRVFLRETSGWTVQKAGPLFAAAAAHIRGNWADYDAIHPTRDGHRITWYDLEHATAFLERAAEGCRQFERYTPSFRVYWSS